MQLPKDLKKATEEPQKITVQKTVEPGDLHQVFRWDAPNWGWIFFGILLGFIVHGCFNAMWRRIGGSPG